jgi:hypothetical protein
MRDKLRLHYVIAVAGLVLIHSSVVLFAQGPQPVNPVQAGEPIPVLSPNELDSLVAPIALYPDPLISQILVAATYPLEIVEAYQWLQRNPGLTGPALMQAAEAQNWDPSVQALVMFPDVLKRLNEDVTWTRNLGNAFLAQQADVMAAVQRMRVSAQQAGKLVSTPQQQVITSLDAGQPVVIIAPTNPDVIYVPVYDPLWVWGPSVYYPYPRWYYPAYGPGVFFSAGISIGSFLGGGFGGWNSWGWYPGWRNRTIVVNNTFIQRYHFNTAYVANRYGPSVWSHNTYHRQGVVYSSPAVSQRYRGAVWQDSRQRHVPNPAPGPTRSFVPTRPSGPVGVTRIAPDSGSRTGPTPRQGITNRAFVPSGRQQWDRGDSGFNRNRSAVPSARSAMPSQRHEAPAFRGAQGGAHDRGSQGGGGHDRGGHGGGRPRRD